jgi:PAS domain S-box-containing protein
MHPSHPLRVLLIEDQEDEALLTRTLLENLPGTAATCEWVATAQAGLEALLQGRHDVCLLDYVLDEEVGTELLRRARAHAVHTPVILLTGKGSREVDLAAMEAGAVDYLQKGKLDPTVLERALRYAVERHRAQERLRESEERNRAMFDHLPLGLFRVGMNGSYQEANPALIRILEHPDRAHLEDSLARHFFVGTADQARFIQALERSGEVQGFETRVVSGAGRTLRLRVSARIHRGPGGEAEYVEGAVEDLTGDPSASRTEEEAASFRALRQASGMGIVRADPDGQLLEMNAEARAMTGTPAGGEGVLSLWTLVHPADEDRVARAVDELTSGARDRVSREVRIMTPDGQGRPHLLKLAAVMGRGGALGSIVGILTPLEGDGTSPSST